MYNDNVNGEASHLRDVYLEAQRDYVKYLMQFEDIRQLVAQINASYDPDYLFEVAQNLVERVDAGEFDDEEMEKVEGELIVLLSAIQDKVLIKELIKLPDYEQELGYGRSR